MSYFLVFDQRLWLISHFKLTSNIAVGNVVPDHLSGLKKTMAWITAWLPCGYQNTSSCFVVWSPLILDESRRTELFDVRAYRTARSWMKNCSVWMVTVTLIEFTEHLMIVLHESTPLSILLRGVNGKMKTRSENCWEFRKWPRRDSALWCEGF